MLFFNKLFALPYLKCVTMK